MINSVIQVLPRLVSAKFIISSVEHEKRKFFLKAILSAYIVRNLTKKNSKFKTYQKHNSLSDIYVCKYVCTEML